MKACANEYFQVTLFDTIDRHLLPYERVMDFALGVHFECIIVPLRSGLHLAIFNPTESSVLDVLRLGARGRFAAAIDSALRRPPAPVRVSLGRHLLVLSLEIERNLKSWAWAFTL